MAKTAKRKYAPSAGKDVKNEMHRYKRGTAKSGPGGKGGKVKNRKQAIAIGLSKARRKGEKVPRKRASQGHATKPAPASRTRRPLCQPRPASGMYGPYMKTSGHENTQNSIAKRSPPQRTEILS
jgi:hypothetical protein